MRFTTTLLLLLIACAGCQTRSSVPANAQLRDKLRTVTIADGISRTEAEVIAKCYFAQNVGCGAFTGIQDGDDHWIVDAKFGYAGDQVRGFYIDKRSGRVTSPIGPSYDDPHKIFD